MAFEVLKTATAAVALTLAAGAVQAATLTVTCSVGNVDSYSLSNAANKAGCFSGNDKNTIDPTNQTLFGFSDWVLAGASDNPSGTEEIDITVSGTNTANPTWTIDLGGVVYERLMIALKQGNSYAVFLLDQTLGATATGFSGTWGTEGPGNSENDLSHASIYYSGDVAPIPLPAAAWLLLGGLGALGVASRKRKAA